MKEINFGNFVLPKNICPPPPLNFESGYGLVGNSNSLLIRTESESPGLTSYIYCKFNLENPKPRSQQCFFAPFLCISPMIPFTASDFMLCLSEIQSPNALRTSIFRQVCGALLRVNNNSEPVGEKQIPHLSSI